MSNIDQDMPIYIHSLINDTILTVTCTKRGCLLTAENDSASQNNQC